LKNYKKERKRKKLKDKLARLKIFGYLEGLTILKSMFILEGRIKKTKRRCGHG
jgi:hypothetical protein